MFNPISLSLKGKLIVSNLFQCLHNDHAIERTQFKNPGILYKTAALSVNMLSKSLVDISCLTDIVNGVVSRIYQRVNGIHVMRPSSLIPTLQSRLLHAVDNGYRLDKTSGFYRCCQSFHTLLRRVQSVFGLVVAVRLCALYALSCH